MKYARLVTIVGMVCLAIAVLTSPVHAALEDILYEKGQITKEEWLKAKADKEREEAEREKQAKDASKGVVTHDQKKAKWVDSVTWSGDLRVRHEQFWRQGAAVGVDRSRQRFRLRLGPEIKMGDFKLNVQIGTSTSTDGINGDQASHNQSFDNAFGQKEIFILQAYGRWNPSFFTPMTLAAGKMKNPFFTQYTNDVLFDGDVSPEGLAEQFNFKVTDTINLFTNLGQFVLDEDSGDSNDQGMLAYQVGTEAKLGDNKLRVAVGYFDALNLGNGGISEPTIQQFNSRAAAVPTNATAYVNDYNVLHLVGSFDTAVLGFPVEFLGDFVKNTTGVISCANNAANAPGRCGGVRVDDQDMGYQVGLKVGKASKAKTWELAYYYKWLQADAVLSAFADSDLGPGGTNRRGHIVWVGYNFTDFLNFKVKFFNTQPLEKALCGTTADCRDDIDRMQVDMAWAF